MKYAIFDEKGLPKGFYSPDIHSNIPENAVEITDEQWREFINNQGKRAWDFKTKQVIDITDKVWDDENKQWRDKTEQEIIAEKKNILLNQLNSNTTSYILQHYPDIKQKSDLADKEFYTTLLINKLSLTANEIANRVYNASANILSGISTLQDEVEKLSKDKDGNEITFDWNGQTVSTKLPWEQLIKVGVRTGWVQLVKQKYYEIKRQIEDMSSLKELEKFNLGDIEFPEFPKF